MGQSRASRYNDGNESPASHQRGKVEVRFSADDDNNYGSDNEDSDRSEPDHSDEDLPLQELQDRRSLMLNSSSNASAKSTSRELLTPALYGGGLSEKIHPKSKMPTLRDSSALLATTAAHSAKKVSPSVSISGKPSPSVNLQLNMRDPSPGRAITSASLNQEVCLGLLYTKHKFYIQNLIFIYNKPTKPFLENTKHINNIQNLMKCIQNSF